MRQHAPTPVLALLLAGLAIGCGDDAPTNPPGGGGGATIQAFTNTIGINPDADGYRVRVAGQGVNRTENVGPVDAVTFGSLSEGDYTVSLEAVAGNCIPDEAQVTFSLTEASPRLISFRIVCS